MQPNEVTRAQLSRQIIDACLEMDRLGINQGTAGNISSRYQDGMLITPTSTPYGQLSEDDIVFVDGRGIPESGCLPSTEWRFHLAIYQHHNDHHAVVHNHAPYATSLAIMNRAIPAVHYMIAAAGGTDIPCAPYATYGTEALSALVVAALAERKACLLQHHGMVACEVSIAKALWLANEVELLARWYCQLLASGYQPETAPRLPDEEIAVVKDKFKRYGLQS